MKRWKNKIYPIVIILLLIIYGNHVPNQDLLSPSELLPSPLLTHESTDKFLVTRVIDGDTIQINTGEKIRYIGINSPEKNGTINCFGYEATIKNSDLVLGKEVRLEKDISDRDKYGRLLRYVYVSELFINKELVITGYARASTFPPDIKFQNIFLESEKIAKEKNLGLWSSCD